ncbi:UDP-N-acetylmuramoyl-L-alanine--D-glutamate ligase [Peptostreptococcus anaerobius]|uniref:UDP-N-acetylmuramoyl-L-alanine--D-glutamate ligase n=1 Tax=Peptostreptococcus anaerobius TaxID=1261 RepID=UPI00232FC5EB|nr:UDP-N-acetylmuramoyl-L-alanine--D-glutamate ligase [Peptostreptococcus anaerobius]MDB8820801.1 UDP-N-acetylmuramoyl-L-alanine--D-glutamate ligase [Peptostreptococcus anaerobius]MDB8825198.1 UDP-N-acetylmuramoyl-L-alanine--D-glutamate ligase [Peptostreptococcus anaerobius]MDB8827031.1 UDP-N-acetylmuramoyl-L-alanine--D-glutamate ligase [Peptostreptococcus anaerobius]MDB8829116.1 UDP-N-acetylmuramoyl-L-alanine--D-glutamate ligase [Peptostreptococcus anaerobius]MDB8830710.1 UDP-N-acetylmuramoyl
MYENKKILVVGMARSGLAAARYLLRQGAVLVVNDSKSQEDLKDICQELESMGDVRFILGRNPNIDEVEDIDMAVVSPGVPLDLDYIMAIKMNRKKVISEIELAYQAGLKKNIRFVGITGTNGKTTTTSLVGEIFKAQGVETYVVGNIGNPAIEAVEMAGDGAVLVTELSSFQLESIDMFSPTASTVLNLTEDHLNRHHTMENYAKAKARIFENQVDDTVCILNYDDPITRSMAEDCHADVVFFSRKDKFERGIYLDDDNNIIVNNEIEEIALLKADQLSLPGGHNLENCMAAIGLTLALGVEIEVLVKVLKTFKAVEHRLEYVDTVKGVKYVNDSKGTNPDSTIKAVQSYNDPIILIAGGYDKGSDFNELFEIAKDYVRSVVILGQTGDLIEDTARKHGFTDLYRVNDLKEAVEKSAQIAKEKDIVLLSPACASWGMYNNYEERGREFKNLVADLEK